MTTIFLGKGCLASDRLVVDYCNHFKTLECKQARSSGGAVALALKGDHRDPEQLKDLANICEALEWISAQRKNFEDETDNRFLPLMERLTAIVEKDTLYIIYKSKGKVRQCIYDANKPEDYFKHVIGEAVVTGGTGASIMEFEIRWQEEQEMFDIKEAYKEVARQDFCSSEEHDVTYGEDLNDCAEVEVNWDEVLK